MIKLSVKSSNTRRV